MERRASAPDWTGEDARPSTTTYFIVRSLSWLTEIGEDGRFLGWETGIESHPKRYLNDLQRGRWHSSAAKSVVGTKMALGKMETKNFDFYRVKVPFKGN